MPREKQYIAIDLKSFYASVECVERGLDPLKTNLVVADRTRTEKTVCLAVTPALKAYGISGRARLFEVTETVKRINRERARRCPGGFLCGSSTDSDELSRDPALALDFIVAQPRMSLYMEVSAHVYRIYLKYFSPQDIHVYSVDEVFIDCTPYLGLYGDAQTLTRRIIGDILASTGITATAGIGTNLYLCKIAMDIEAKKMQPDENGARIAVLDERSYRERLWEHRPLTDFWRIGAGSCRRLESHGMYTMGDVARCSLGNEELLYRLFGVNAELLIDHAWGCESCTVEDIKNYRPQTHSMSTSQVLKCPYGKTDGELIIREMTDSLVLDAVRRRVKTSLITLDIGYDVSNDRTEYTCSARDRYGRAVPPPSHVSVNFGKHTSSSALIISAAVEAYRRTAKDGLLVRRLTVSLCLLADERNVEKAEAQTAEQLDMFTDYSERDRRREEEKAALERERRWQLARLTVRDRYGKAMLLRGCDGLPAATARERCAQIGGHRA